MRKVSKHPSFQRLLAYLRDELSAAEKETVKGHLETCTHCQQELNLARRVLLGAKNELHSPPSDLLGRVTAAFRHWRSRSPSRPQRQAVLRFDSWAQLAALGVRGTPQERLLLFSENAFDLDVQVARSEANTFALRGQVLGKGSQPDTLEGIELRVVNADGAIRRGLTDEVGCFSFTQLPEGTYSVHVVFEDHDVVLGPIVAADNRNG